MRATPIAGAAITAIFAIFAVAWYSISDTEKEAPLAQPTAVSLSSHAGGVLASAKPSEPAPIETTGTISRRASAESASRAASAPAPPVARPVAKKCSAKALGVSRVVEIDTTGGPGFGFEHFKTYDFLEPNEVVLTFDDGPWPNNTPAVLAALAAQCVRATFFVIGKHATWHPQILKQVAAQGHSIGSHTWSHVDLTKKSQAERADEIEKGISVVNAIVAGSAAPFFRFPALRHPAETVEYLGGRNIASFSTDIDSLDFKTKNPEQIVSGILANLRKRGKGIILLHDFQQATAVALPQLLNQLQANGYRIVHLQAKEQVRTLAEYDALVSKDLKGSTADARSTASVVRTISRTGD